jgi:tRNA threonylcarbamoyladenosine biosynthesis protein TsaE
VIELRTSSADETKDLGAALAGVLVAGDLLLLVGDLGAGKTAFAQGLGAGLGVTDPITSPTFTLASRYEGDHLLFHHLDVYRLEGLAEVGDLDLPELLEDEAVVAIEWGDSILPALPADHLEVRLVWEGVDDERSIALVPAGTRWRARMAALGRATKPWVLGATPPGGED